MNIQTGTVKFPVAKIFETQYGLRQNAVITLDNGDEVKIWKEPNSQISTWKKGDKVQVIRTDKGWSVPDNSLQTNQSQPFIEKNTPPVLNQQRFSNAQSNHIQRIPDAQTKIEMAKYIEFMTKTYHYTYTQVCNEMQNENLKDELLKDIATSIFIQTNKKFGL